MDADKQGKAGYVCHNIYSRHVNEPAQITLTVVGQANRLKV